MVNHPNATAIGPKSTSVTCSGSIVANNSLALKSLMQSSTCWPLWHVVDIASIMAPRSMGWVERRHRRVRKSEYREIGKERVWIGRNDLGIKIEIVGYNMGGDEVLLLNIKNWLASDLWIVKMILAQWFLKSVCGVIFLTQYMNQIITGRLRDPKLCKRYWGNWTSYEQIRLIHLNKLRTLITIIITP